MNWKHWTTAGLALGLATMPALAQDAAADSTAEATTEAEAPAWPLEEQVSYSFGYDIGVYMLANEVDLNRERFMAGLEAALAEAEPALSDEARQQAMMMFQMQQQELAIQRMQELAAENLAEAEAFLEAKRAEEGVIETESGLLYKVITAGGEGASPAMGDNVLVHYTGTFIDGEVFDSSVERGEPQEFPMVPGFIEGWLEGMQLMTPGAEYEFYIHPDLGYGADPSRLPPNSALVFNVQLLDVMPAETEEAEEAPPAQTELEPLAD